MDRYRPFVKRNPKERLTTLLHPIHVDSLRAVFFALKRAAAAGVDGITWTAYKDGLGRRLADLCGRVHSGAYRATPVRRVERPKPDGGTRPLGLAALEDKIVREAGVGGILAPVYEAECCGFSSGFRPRRSAHNALDALGYVIERRTVNFVVDADLRKFFDTVDQTGFVRFLEHRTGDKRVIRLILKWLKAGVMQAGVWQDSELGPPQGAVLSPMLANVYLHYALDLWFQAWRSTQRSAGEAYLIRYADDGVVCVQYKGEAERFLRELQVRLEKFGFSLHPDKTRRIEFGRYAEENGRRRGEGRPKTFDFLGFTHYCRKDRKGRFGLGRKPIAKRRGRFLKRVKVELIRRLHRKVQETGRWLGRVLNGWLNYYAVPTSFRNLRRCYPRLYWSWMRVLRRRSPKDKASLKEMDLLTEKYWPKLEIRPPWPDARMAVMRGGAPRGRSRMR